MYQLWYFFCGMCKNELIVLFYDVYMLVSLCGNGWLEIVLLRGENFNENVFESGCFGYDCYFLWFCWYYWCFCIGRDDYSYVVEM